MRQLRAGEFIAYATWSLDIKDWKAAAPKKKAQAHPKMRTGLLGCDIYMPGLGESSLATCFAR